MLSRFLLATSGPFGYGLIVVAAVVGPFIAQTAGGGAGTNWATGGVAGAAIAFAGVTVRYMGGMVDKERVNTDKERTRGDRLEAAVLATSEKSIAAMGSSSLAVTELTREVQELRRGSK